MEPSFADYIRLIPKAELHIHLEGSVTPAVLQTLSRRHGTELAEFSEAQLAEKFYKFEDFTGFLETYKTICRHLRGPDDYAPVLDWLTAYFEAQNVRYAEVIFSPSIPWRFGWDGRQILESLLDWGGQLERRKNIAVRWILDCVRQFGPEPARETAELAYAHRDRGVVAVGMGGDERSLPLTDYAEVFGWVRAHGLYIHIHAGELGEPEQIRQAIDLGVNRIGHGIQAARDAQLIDYLRDHALPLDICLTSNSRTRAWNPISENPFWLLYKRGVPVTLNSDDPGIFDVTISQEYAKAAYYFSLSREEIDRLALQGIHSSFLPHTHKMELMQDFHEQIRRLNDPSGPPPA